MILSRRQQTYFFSYLWPELCRVRGWSPSDRAQRHHWAASILHRQHRLSFSDWDQHDFDTIKSACLAAIRPADLDAQLDQLEQPARRARRKIAELIMCLRLYVDDADAYVQRIVRHKFGADDWRQLSSTPPAPHWRSHLDQLIMTLSRCLNGRHGLRAQAGHSLHDMRTAAGLRCACRQCARQRMEDRYKDTELCPSNCPF